MQVRCTAWKQAVDGDLQGYVNEYKRVLLEALVREGVSDVSQIRRGIAAIKSDFLPNPDRFASDCKGGGEITGAWGTGAHKIYQPERLLDNCTSEDRRDRLAQIRGML